MLAMIRDSLRFLGTTWAAERGIYIYIIVQPSAECCDPKWRYRDQCMAPMVKRCGFPMFSHKFRDGQRTKMRGQKSGSPWHGTTCPSVFCSLGKHHECWWLVGGLEHVFYILYIFYSIWDVILPIDELIFFKMVWQPPTRLINHHYQPLITIIHHYSPLSTIKNHEPGCVGCVPHSRKKARWLQNCSSRGGLRRKGKSA